MPSAMEIELYRQLPHLAGEVHLLSPRRGRASFFFGCRYLQYIAIVNKKSTGLLQAEEGRSPMVRGATANEMLAMIAREDIPETIKKTGKYSNSQFRTLIAGAAFFLIWHVLGIVLRS